MNVAHIVLAAGSELPAGGYAEMFAEQSLHLELRTITLSFGRIHAALDAARRAKILALFRS